MKNLKIPFFFIVVFSFFQLASCTLKEELKSLNLTTRDSIDVFIQKMKNDTLDLKTRLYAANKSLKWLEKTKDSSNKKDILTYKIYLFGNLKQYDSAVYTSKELLQKSIEKMIHHPLG